MLIALTAMGGWKDHKERNGQIYCTVDAAGCLQDEIAAQARNINGRYVRVLPYYDIGCSDP